MDNGWAKRPVRVLVVDGSTLSRRFLGEGLRADARIEVIGAVGDAYAARDYLVRQRPDAMTLDLNLPRMDGLAFLRKFMPVIPTPTVVLQPHGGSEDSARASLQAGAAFVLKKPRLIGDPAAATAELRARLLAAARANPGHKRHPIPRTEGSVAKAMRAILPPGAALNSLLPEASAFAQPAQAGAPDSPAFSPAKVHWREGSGRVVVVIGGSTGGVAALSTLLPAATPTSPPIVIAQHMPAGHTASLAQALSSQLQVPVLEASEGLPLSPGRVILAAANDRHTVLKRVAGGFCVGFQDGEKRCYQRPAVDALFESAARQFGPAVVGVLLTGMGSDGAVGLLAVRNAGGLTVCQDETSSVVFGMPAAALRLGAAQQMASLAELPRVVGELIKVAAGRMREPASSPSTVPATGSSATDVTCRGNDK